MWSGDITKTAVAVRKGVCDVVLRNKYMCVVHVTKENQLSLVVSPYCRHAGDIDRDIEHLRRVA